MRHPSCWLGWVRNLKPNQHCVLWLLICCFCWCDVDFVGILDLDRKMPSSEPFDNSKLRGKTLHLGLSSFLHSRHSEEKGCFPFHFEQDYAKHSLPVADGPCQPTHGSQRQHLHWRVSSINAGLILAHAASGWPLDTAGSQLTENSNIRVFQLLNTERIKATDIIEWTPCFLLFPMLWELNRSSEKTRTFPQEVEKRKNWKLLELLEPELVD